MDEPQVANALVPQGFWEVACMQMMGCSPGPRCVWSFLQHPPGKHWRFKYAAVISKCTRAFRLFLCVYASAATTVGGCKTVSVGCGAGALPHIAREKAVRMFSLHAFARRCARHALSAQPGRAVFQRVAGLAPAGLSGAMDHLHKETKKIPLLGSRPGPPGAFKRP